MSGIKRPSSEVTLDDTTRPESVVSSVSQNNDLEWVLMSTLSDGIIEVSEKEVQRPELVKLMKDVANGVAESFQDSPTPVNVIKTWEVRVNDNINKRVNQICDQLNNNRDVLLVSSGKDSQKLISVVEIVKQLIVSGDDVVVLSKKKNNDNNNNNTNNNTNNNNQTSEEEKDKKTFKYRCYKQYNKLEFLNVEAQVNIDGKTKKHKRAKLAQLVDPTAKKMMNVPVLCIFLQNVETIDKSTNDYKNLKLINNNWTFQSN
ncbi:hypothetical protein DASC09_020600 [Saccharomycopsis crataegensis]|uniref:DNA/RNA-binding protein Alba-like domain-containing protein n=1 Tax=Saccharomycopsis crataegensis TaxID=43959 RepID=A0AAV5QIH1_9ASCO|nr:hypothetical protein DASC09_020600 [Saccharomycopsis crataegensis]